MLFALMLMIAKWEITQSMFEEFVSYFHFIQVVYAKLKQGVN